MYTTGQSRTNSIFNAIYCYTPGIQPNADIQLAFRIKDLAGNETIGATGYYYYDNY
jgi:hypothetical protein